MAKKRFKKGEFARKTVRYCIGILTIVLLWAIVAKTVALCFDRTIDISDVLTYAGAAFGGELLLLAFKRVFADRKKVNKDVEEIDEP